VVPGRSSNLDINCRSPLPMSARNRTIPGVSLRYAARVGLSPALSFSVLFPRESLWPNHSMSVALVNRVIALQHRAFLHAQYIENRYATACHLGGAPAIVDLTPLPASTPAPPRRATAFCFSEGDSRHGLVPDFRCRSKNDFSVEWPCPIPSSGSESLIYVPIVERDLTHHSALSTDRASTTAQGSTAAVP